MYTRAGKVAANRVQSLSGRQKSTRRRNQLILIGGLIAGSVATSYFLSNNKTLNESLNRKKIFLALDLAKPIEEVIKPSLFNVLNPPISFYDLLRVLKYASEDSKVQGVVAHVSDASTFSLAQIEELIQAVNLLKIQGKETHCYVDSINLSSNYLLASSFDKIHLAPTGTVTLAGYLVEQPFLKSFFEWLGVRPDFIQRKEYKNAVNMFTENQFTEAHKESMTSIYQSIYQTIYSGIAKSRNMTVSELIEHAKQSPLSSDQALKGGLVDTLQYSQDLVGKLKNGDYRSDVKKELIDAIEEIKQAKARLADPSSAKDQDKPLEQVISESLNVMNKQPPPVKLERFQKYAQKVLSELATKDKAHRAINRSIKPSLNQTTNETKDQSINPGGEVALVYGIGNVVDTYNPYEPKTGQFSAPLLSKMFHSIAADKNISAVVFRIDSPGGSSSASDAIHSAIMEVKKAGKPVVVSMSGMAASGGYYVAAPADYIFAQRSTLTGSIGVYGGKFGMRNLLQNRVHLSFDRLHVGHEDDVAAGLTSTLDPWTLGQRERMERMIDRIYAEFVSKVAGGRKMSLYDAEKLAHGRVWMGEQALKIGLVDEIGGLQQAIEKAKELSKSPNAVVTVAGQKNPLKQLIQQALGQIDAEWDDEPIFGQQSKVQQMCSMFISQFFRTGMQYVATSMKQEMASALGVPVSTINQSSSSSQAVSLNAAHGPLNSFVDSEGRCKI